MRTPWGTARLALLLFCCATAAAEPKQDGIAVIRDQPASHANHVPGDVTLYLSVKDAAKLRKLPAGELVESIFAAFVPEGEVRSAWRELSRTVGMPPDQSFDMLLGRRATLIARKTDNAPPSWAILTEIDHHTFRILHAKLKGAPRDIIKGRPVLALERGKFLLTTAPTKRKGTNLALLGPRTNADLFEQIAGSLGGFHKAPLSADIHFARARELDRDASLLFFTRNTDNPPAQGQHTNNQNPSKSNGQSRKQLGSGGGDGVGSGVGVGSGGGGGWLALTAITSGTQITIKGLSQTPHRTEHQIYWSERAFNSMSEGALAAVMDDALLASIPFDPAGFFDLPQLTALADDALLTEAWVFRMLDTNQGLTFAEAAHSSNINRLAPRADRVIADSLAERLADPAIAENDFADFDHSITRAINLASFTDQPTRSPIAPMPALAWRFDRAAEPPPSQPNAGWWVLATSPDAVDQLSDHIATATAEHPDRWVSRGILHPAKITETLTQGAPLPAFLPFLDPFTRIKTVEWRAADADQDLLYLQFDINLTEPTRARVRRVK